MKYNILFFIITAVLMSGCSATMYHGYVDELYTIPGSSPQIVETNNEEGRVVQTVEEVEYDTEDSRIIYDTEESYNSYDSQFSFSIMSPGFYVGVGSQGWGGWFYPYFGPHVAYHYSPWYWDPYWNTSFYSWYWDPFMMHNPWYNPYYSHYGGYYGWNNYHYWGFNNGVNRTPISHRESNITHRRPNNGKQLRQTPITNTVRQNIRPAGTGSHSAVRGNSSVVRKPENSYTRESDTKPIRGGSNVGSSKLESGNQLSRESPTIPITHTREPQGTFKDHSTTKPIRSNVNIGGDRYKPASGSSNSNYDSYRAKEPQNSNSYKPTNSARPQKPSSNSVRPTNNSNSHRSTGRSVESSYSKPSNKRQSVSSPSRGSSNSGSRSSGSSSSPRGNSGSRGSSGKSSRTR